MMEKDYKYGLIFGSVLAVILLIWFSAGTDSDLNKREESESKIDQLQKETKTKSEVRIKLDQEPEVPFESRQEDKSDYRRFHIVRIGESLSDISKKYYGNTGSWKKIYQANKEKIEDVNKIRPGTELTIP